MSLRSMNKKGSEIFKGIDELDTLLFTIENEHDLAELEDKPELSEYTDSKKYIRIGKAYGEFITGLTPTEIYTLLSDSIKYLVDLDRETYTEYEGGLFWEGGVNPVDQDSSIHIGVGNSLRVMNEIMLVINRLQKDKAKVSTRKSLTRIKGVDSRNDKGKLRKNRENQSFYIDMSASYTSDGVRKPNRKKTKKKGKNK